MGMDSSDFHICWTHLKRRHAWRSHWIHWTVFTLWSDLASSWSRHFPWRWNLSWFKLSPADAFGPIRLNFPSIPEPISCLLMNTEGGRSDSGTWRKTWWDLMLPWYKYTRWYFHKGATITAGTEDLEKSFTLLPTDFSPMTCLRNPTEMPEGGTTGSSRL